MASIDTSQDTGKKGPGVKKAKRLSTVVDMTPMVDLGFLLITFFIFTATMTSPTAMDLIMPKDVQDKKQETAIKNSGALTLMLGKDNHLYYYEGLLKEDGSNFKSTTYKEVRQIILNRKEDAIKAYTPDAETDKEIQDNAKKNGDPFWEAAPKEKDFFVVVKPTNESTFKNMVDVLDELTICDVKRKAIVKIAEGEMQLIQATEAALPKQ